MIDMDINCLCFFCASNHHLTSTTKLPDIGLGAAIELGLAELLLSLVPKYRPGDLLGVAVDLALERVMWGEGVQERHTWSLKVMLWSTTPPWPGPVAAEISHRHSCLISFALLRLAELRAARLRLSPLRSRRTRTHPAVAPSSRERSDNPRRRLG